MAAGRQQQLYCPRCDHCQASNFPLTPDFNIPVSFVAIPTSPVTDHPSLDDAFPTSTFLDADHMNPFQHEIDESTTMCSESALDLTCAKYCRETSAQTASRSGPKAEIAVLHPDPLAYFTAERPGLTGNSTPAHYDSQGPEDASICPTSCSRDVSDPDASKVQQQLDAAVLLAAQEGHSAIIAILLGRGGHVEARDGQGRTPLRICVEHGHAGVAETLLAAGADCTSSDDVGKSIMSVAVQANSERLVELLAASFVARQGTLQQRVTAPPGSR